MWSTFAEVNLVTTPASLSLTSIDKEHTSKKLEVGCVTCDDTTSSESHEFVDRKQTLHTGATTLNRGGSCIDRAGVFSQQCVHYIQAFVVHAGPMQGQPWLAIGCFHGKYK
jgi:hypothetical protein